MRQQTAALLHFGDARQGLSTFVDLLLFEILDVEVRSESRKQEVLCVKGKMSRLTGRPTGELRFEFVQGKTACTTAYAR